MSAIASHSSQHTRVHHATSLLVPCPATPLPCPALSGARIRPARVQRHGLKTRNNRWVTWTPRARVPSTSPPWGRTCLPGSLRVSRSMGRDRRGTWWCGARRLGRRSSGGVLISCCSSLSFYPSLYDCVCLSTSLCFISPSLSFSLSLAVCDQCLSSFNSFSTATTARLDPWLGYRCLVWSGLCTVKRQAADPAV